MTQNKRMTKFCQKKSYVTTVTTGLPGVSVPLPVLETIHTSSPISGEKTNA